jgi:glycosyltransferase involved in cell wall biosynthesis
VKRPQRILYLQYTNPGAYPPLEHSSRLLAARGWHVLFLGIQIEGEDDLRLAEHPNITVRLISKSGAAWRQRAHYAWFAIWVFAWALRWRPTWVYASDALTCPVVLPLLALPGVRVVYHEHDSPPAWHGGMRARLKLWTRRFVAKRACVRMLPNEQRRLHFVRSVVDRQPTLCIWNCPRREEVGPSRAAHSGGAVCVLYHGSIVPSRLPLQVLEAVLDLPAHLLVIGYETQGHRGYMSELRTHAEQLGMGQRVRILPGVPRGKLLTLAREADVGLALVPISPDDCNLRYMTGASNKPFDYLAAGLPVLVTDLPEWRQMYVDPGYALACQPDNPHSVNTALRWLIEHPAEMRAMGERGRQRIMTDWNYETQFAPVLNRLVTAS